MSDKKSAIDWMYGVIAHTIPNIDINDSHDIDRVHLLGECQYRFYTSKRSIRNIEEYISDNDVSDQFVIDGKGKTLLQSELHYKHYMDIHFTELGESMMLIKAL